MSTKSFLCSLALAAALPLAARAQHATIFVADVADAATGAPLRDADVVILDLHRVAHTNWLGEAVLSDIDAGPHRVRVRHLGFVAAELTLPFRGDTVGQVFLLAEMPTSLDTVRVQGQRVQPELQPFERRRAIGLGHFLTADQLATEGQRDLRNVLFARIPGLWLQTDRTGQLKLVSARSAADGRSMCGIAIYLDGVKMQTGQTDIWDLTRTWDLAGVEYYTASEAPPQYHPYDGACGVLLLWSRQY